MTKGSFSKQYSTLVRRSCSRILLVSSLVAGGITGTGEILPSHAQQLTQSNIEEELLNEVLDEPPAEILEAIREAPFSEVFTLSIPDRGLGYAVKDRDYDPKHKRVGLYTLWGDIPSSNVLQVSMFYCFRNQAIANAQLEKITLLDGDQVLVTIDQKIVATQAQAVEVAPAYYETTTLLADPFSSPYWGGGYYGSLGTPFPTTTVESIYVPAENCSVGGSRFDLTPVQAEIAQLPNKTLDVRMDFDNGSVETWRLGRGTVEEIKTFPSFNTNS
ncbi:hypothetical protein S7335_4276 [Synechococcus sp. PCC 7335]|uniref:hypothetical protein n=1 Tax=Synechococcus sp. (strain ATCC 29403 / PCC 7335) TaxID=91464 RepID=UPI00017EC42E|nr:hypothetical protein [Synechococcus sp. PCC 7335]EDX86571.1 hypothetical protein S7335_4276 [Synechococcus sp. PCC 7335]